MKIAPARNIRDEIRSLNLESVGRGSALKPVRSLAGSLEPASSESRANSSQNQLRGAPPLVYADRLLQRIKRNAEGRLIEGKEGDDQQGKARDQVVAVVDQIGAAVYGDEQNGKIAYEVEAFHVDNARCRQCFPEVLILPSSVRHAGHGICDNLSDLRAKIRLVNIQTEHGMIQ